MVTLRRWRWTAAHERWTRFKPAGRAKGRSERSMVAEYDEHLTMLDLESRVSR
tara:strand:+ start:1408 stop:1566 length:159 start_codon:yes stop_codon:yes gene_type:complete